MYQHYIIYLHHKHDCILGHTDNADKIPVFLDMSTSTINDETKASKSVLVNTKGHEKLEITVMPSVSADGKELIPYVILKRKILPNEKCSLWNSQKNSQSNG
jgi:hypothetical protein